jgi:hypothetical protein
MNREAIDFNRLVNQVVEQPQVGRESLALWGGTCAEDKLDHFLGNWCLQQMPYRIWQYTDRIKFRKKEQVWISNIALLERGRLFGPGGDLDLRRDGDTFRWRFVGVPDMRPPANHDAKKSNFWEQHPGAQFHCYTETALLWGERKDERWHDDRVAAAELNYPVLDGTQRVEVEYRVYSRAGRVEFVWLTGLQEWKEESDG